MCGVDAANAPAICILKVRRFERLGAPVIAERKAVGGEE